MNLSPLPACPDSWYYLGRADALVPGELKTRYLGEQALTVYRTAQGRVVADPTTHQDRRAST
jgi:phenylpropionate dioxygenase-like ring-hydroxylating dioxygenase large terminal subunit